MLYCILGRDAPDSLQRRQRVRSEHLARVQALCDQGLLLTAGPFAAIDSPDPGPAGFVGSLIVAEFDSLLAARQWAESDPYLESGAWQGVEVHPYRQVLP